MVLVPDATRFFISALPYITEGQTGGFNVSLKASLDRFGFPSELVATARLVAAAALLALLTRIRGPLSRSPALAAGALIAATPLVSSYFFATYFVYLIAATGAIAFFVRTREIVLLSAAGFLLLADFTFRASNEAIDDLVALRHVVGAVLLILAVVELSRREIRERPVSSLA